MSQNSLQWSTVSQRFGLARVSSHTKDVRKQVHFDSCTTDILTTLAERNNLRFSQQPSCHSKPFRPILKFSEEMTEDIRRAGSGFARVLSGLGMWCTGVTSENPNVRSDMYKQIVAQIRATSAHLRQAGESVLQANIHGIWVQLVDDFSIQREEYTSRDMILYYPLN